MEPKRSALSGRRGAQRVAFIRIRWTSMTLIVLCVLSGALWGGPGMQVAKAQGETEEGLGSDVKYIPKPAPPKARPTPPPTPRPGAPARGKPPMARVISIRNKKAVFAVKPFGAVSVGDRFFILTEKRNGLQAELEAEKLSTDGRYVLAKVVDNPDDVPLESLPKRIVLKASDVAPRVGQLGKGPIDPKSVPKSMKARPPGASEDTADGGAAGEGAKTDDAAQTQEKATAESQSDAQGQGSQKGAPSQAHGASDTFDAALNPTAQVAFGAHLERSLAANLLTGVDLDVNMLVQDLVFTTFVPPVGAARWTKMFGIDLAYSFARDAKLDFVRTRLSEKQELTVSASQWRLGLHLRSPIASRWISRAGVRLDVLGSRRELLEFNATSVDPEGKQTLEESGFAALLQSEFNLWSVLYSGLDLQLPLARALKATSKETSAGQTITSEETGEIKPLALRGNLLVRMPFGPRPNQFVMEAQVSYVWKQETLSGMPLVLGGGSRTVTATQWGALLGLGFVH